MESQNHQQIQEIIQEINNDYCRLEARVKGFTRSSQNNHEISTIKRKLNFTSQVGKISLEVDLLVNKTAHLEEQLLRERNSFQQYCQSVDQKIADYKRIFFCLQLWHRIEVQKLKNSLAKRDNLIELKNGLIVKDYQTIQNLYENISRLEFRKISLLESSEIDKLSSSEIKKEYFQLVDQVDEINEAIQREIKTTSYLREILNNQHLHYKFIREEKESIQKEINLVREKIKNQAFSSQLLKIEQLRKQLFETNNQNRYQQAQDQLKIDELSKKNQQLKEFNLYCRKVVLNYLQNKESNQTSLGETETIDYSPEQLDSEEEIKQKISLQNKLFIPGLWFLLGFALACASNFFFLKFKKWSGSK